MRAIPWLGASIEAVNDWVEEGMDRPSRFSMISYLNDRQDNVVNWES